jgi:putative ABC transport system permease protein
MSRSAPHSGARRRTALLLLLPVLTLLTALSAAGIPALVARSQTASLQQALTEASPAERAMVATRQALPSDATTADYQTVSAFDQALNEYASQVPAAAGPEESLAWGGAHLGTSLPLPARGTDAQIDLEYRSQDSAHLRLLSGRMPTDVSTPATGTGPTEFDVALSSATAELYGVSAGAVLSLHGYLLRVTGVYTPTDPSSEFWYFDPSLASPSYVKTHSGAYWATGALVGPGELPALSDITIVGQELDPVAFEFAVPLDTSSYRAGDAGALLTSFNAFDSGAVPADLQVQSTAGPALELTPFQQQRQSTDAILALVLTAVAVIGAVTMLLSAQLVVADRRRHHALLQARGQSRIQLAVGTCLGLGLPNLGAAVLAGAATGLAVPADWTPLSTVLLAAVAAVGLFGPPTIAVIDLRGGAGASRTGRRDLVRRPRTPRRRIFELLVLMFAGVTVFELRSQGLGGVQQGSNTLGTLAPVLIAALATVIAARSYPLLLRPAERVAGKRGGPVSFLGLTAASRSTLPLAAPAFVITLTLTLAALGALMEQAIDTGRTARSWQTVGADGVVTLPGGTAWSAAARADAALAGVPGVTHVTMIASQVDYTNNSEIFAVDPSSYAAVAAGTPWPLGTPLPVTAGSGPVPILVQPGSGAAIGATIEVSPAYAPAFQGRIVGFVSQTPAAPGALAADLKVVLVPDWAVSANAADWPASQILVSGTAIDEGAMNAALGRYVPGATAAYRADVLNQYAHAPLAGLAEFAYLIGLLVAGVFGIGAILLSLSLSAPARGRRLTLLGTLGLTPRQARRIALTETVPLMTATVLSGLVAAASMPAVFGSSLDLSAFTGLAGSSSLGWDPGVPLLAALAAALLTALAVAVQAAAASRRNAGTELRMGEEADA